MNLLKKTKADSGKSVRRRGIEVFQSVKMCNCARCGCEMVGDSDSNPVYHSTFYAIQRVFGRLRIADTDSMRPYCELCYRHLQTIEASDLP